MQWSRQELESEPRQAARLPRRNHAHAMSARFRIDHRNLKVVLVANDVGAADPLQKRLELGTAAHRDVLAVVEHDVVVRILKGVGLAADERSPLKQHYVPSGVHEVQGGA